MLCNSKECKISPLHFELKRRTFKMIECKINPLQIMTIKYVQTVTFHHSLLCTRLNQLSCTGNSMSGFEAISLHQCNETFNSIKIKFHEKKEENKYFIICDQLNS